MIHEVSTHVISIHGLCLHVLEALVTFFLGFIMALNLPRCVRFMSGDTEFETLETANTMEFLVLLGTYRKDQELVRTRGVSYQYLLAFAINLRQMQLEYMEHMRMVN